MRVYDSAGRLIYETDRLRELALDRERKITGVVDERPYPYRWPDAVHALLNLGEDELFAVGNRSPHHRETELQR